MKFRCERDVLLDALATTSRAVVSRTGVAHATSGLLVELKGDRLHVTGAGDDLDLVIEDEIAVVGLEDGSCVPPARLVADIVRAFEPGTVTVETAEEEVRFLGGRSSFGVRSYQTEEFPRLPQVEQDGIAMGATDVMGALRQVVRAASTDDLRPGFTGVLMSNEEGSFRLVATDGYRLALRDVGELSGEAGDLKIVVPAKALTELVRMLSASDEVVAQIRLVASDLHAVFEIGSLRLRTRLIKSEYPEYRQLIPSSYPNHLNVAKEGFLDAIRRMRLLVKDGSTSVRLTMDNDGVRLSVLHPELGRAEEDVEAKYEGAELTIAFNPTYLIDGVEAVDGDDVLLETIDANKPAMVRGVDSDSYRYLLMPVRIP